MSILIRKGEPGGEKALAYIQTESRKAAFASILAPDVLEKRADLNRAETMYKRLLSNCIGNGYLLFADGKAHGIAWWDAARDPAFSGKAE